MTAQLIIGATGLTCLVAGFVLGRSLWWSSGLVGVGLGACFYALLLQITDDPLTFVLDFVGRAFG